MRVYEYAAAVGTESSHVLAVIESINEEAGETVIEATAPQSNLTESDVALLDKRKPSSTPPPLSDADQVDAVFNLTERPVIESDPLVDAGKVDAVFGTGDTRYVEKDLPQYEFAVLGHRQKGKGVDTIKLAQVANDESQAINLACKRLTPKVDAGNYKFRVKRIRQLAPIKVMGTPLPVREPQRI